MNLPSWCYHCKSYINSHQRSPTSFLCRDCHAALPLIDPGVCLKCGRTHDPLSCRIEWAKQIRHFYSLFLYQDPVRQWIGSLKYSRNFISGRIFQQMVRDWFDQHSGELASLDFIVPIPLHPLRLSQRGFNQAVYLLNRQKGLKVEGSALKKMRGTGQQAGKNRAQRKASLSGAFQATRSFKGKSVLIFDDVCTTGQTLYEAAKTLKNAGASQIDALVICRSLTV